MDRETFNKIKEDFGLVKWIENPRRGVFGKDWYLIDTNPLPPDDEIVGVVSDIIANRRVAIRNGKVRHLSSCKEKEHIVDRKILRAIKNINNQSFQVAVYKGEPGIIEGKPVAICLNPTISYTQYPDHPHLNADGIALIDKRRFYLPNSLCYIHNLYELGDTEQKVITNALAQIVLWLFRHQVWVATRSMYGKGEWIGPHTPYFPDEWYSTLLNPVNICRCGSNKKYIECCMIPDITKANKCSTEKAKKLAYDLMRGNCWNIDRYIPQLKSLDILKKVLVS